MFEKLKSIFGRRGTTIAVTPKPQAIGTAYGGHTFGGAKYPQGIAGNGAGLTLHPPTLRQNARAAYHETVSAHALVNRFGDTVVNTGLRLEPTPAARLLGITPEAAKDWSDEVGDRFHLWAKSKQSTRDETLTFYQMQRLGEIYTWRDNDWFFRFYYDKRRDLQSPLQVQLIDPQQIMGDTLVSTFCPYQFKDGIARDANGKETSYAIRLQDVKKGGWKFVEIPAELHGRRIMGHCYFADYSGQQRGYPLISHILQELQNLTDFSLSELKKAISQSQIWGWVEPSDDADSSDVVDGMTRRMTTSTVGGASTVAPSGAETVDEIPAIQPVYEASITQPGQVLINRLRAGEKIHPFNNTSPSTGFDQFFDAVIKNLASSASMPPEVLVMKFGENYSASRGALLMFWQVVQMWRAELEADFLAPVYESWLSEEIAAGRILAPGWSDPRLRAAWLDANWVGVAMPNIDPQRTAEAIRAHMEMGLTTQEREARALNGSSAQSNRARLTTEFEETPDAPWNVKEPAEDRSANNGE